jgi:hypothetical protein
LPIVEKLLESIKFQEAQNISYDPKKIIVSRKQASKCGPFEHQEIEGIESLANLEVVE